MTFEQKRVVVTGIGAVTPIGNTAAQYWEGLLSGRNGIAPITLFDASQHKCRIAGEVKEFNPQQYLEAKDIKRIEKDMSEFDNNKDSKLAELQTSLEGLKKNLNKNTISVKTMQKELQASRLESEQAGSDLSAAEEQLAEAVSDESSLCNQ